MYVGEGMVGGQKLRTLTSYYLRMRPLNYFCYLLQVIQKVLHRITELPEEIRSISGSIWPFVKSRNENTVPEPFKSFIHIITPHYHYTLGETKQQRASRKVNREFLYPSQQLIQQYGKITKPNIDVGLELLYEDTKPQGKWTGIDIKTTAKTTEKPTVKPTTYPSTTKSATTKVIETTLKTTTKPTLKTIPTVIPVKKTTTLESIRLSTDKTTTTAPSKTEQTTKTRQVKPQDQKFINFPVLRTSISNSIRLLPTRITKSNEGEKKTTEEPQILPRERLLLIEKTTNSKAFEKSVTPSNKAESTIRPKFLPFERLRPTLLPFQRLKPDAKTTPLNIAETTTTKPTNYQFKFLKPTAKSKTSTIKITKSNVPVTTTRPNSAVIKISTSEEIKPSTESKSVESTWNPQKTEKIRQKIRQKLRRKLRPSKRIPILRSIPVISAQNFESFLPTVKPITKKIVITTTSEPTTTAEITTTTKVTTTSLPTATTTNIEGE